MEVIGRDGSLIETGPQSTSGYDWIYLPLLSLN